MIGTGDELFAYMKSWSATRLCIEAKGDDFYFEAYKRVKAIWGSEKNRKKIKMKFCILLGKDNINWKKCRYCTAQSHV